VNRTIPRVLIVEDDPTIAYFLGRLFDLWAGRVHARIISVSVSTVAAALHQLEEPALFDMVFLDVMLPDASGLAVLRHVRQSHLDLPVVIVSSMDIIDKSILDLHPFDILRKPVVIDRLEAIILDLVRDFKPPRGDS
jgi:CheY-like chemotaxis protein